MQLAETPGDMVDINRLPEADELVPLKISGIDYYSASEVARAVGISRQSLWRWRQEGKVPRGRRYRDRQILFTAGELEQILEYANRLEPTEPASTQLGLFQDGKRGSE